MPLAEGTCAPHLKAQATLAGHSRSVSTVLAPSLLQFTGLPSPYPLALSVMSPPTRHVLFSTTLFFATLIILYAIFLLLSAPKR